MPRHAPLTYFKRVTGSSHPRLFTSQSFFLLAISVTCEAMDANHCMRCMGPWLERDGTARFPAPMKFLFVGCQAVEPRAVHTHVVQYQQQL